jgi:hypothetical protein
MLQLGEKELEMHVEKNLITVQFAISLSLLTLIETNHNSYSHTLVSEFKKKEERET